MANNVNEMRLFSNRANDKMWNKVLRDGSNSAKTAALRKDTYQKVFSRYNELKNAAKMFSGYNEFPLLSNQYFNATMASYVRSFAGFLTIERDMDQPTALLYYMDLLGVTNNRIVLPNIGKENLNNINARFTTSANFGSQAAQTITTGKKLIPGSIVLTIIPNGEVSKAIEIKDDRNGNLLAPAGVLSKGEVNYNAAGKIEFTWTPKTGEVLADSKYSIIAYEDVAGTPEWNGTAPGNNRFKLDMQNITVTSEPDMLVAESNLMAMASMQKAIGVNPQDIAGTKLTELYTKLINQKLVHCIMDSYEGNVVELDPEISKFTEFKSRLDCLATQLVDIDAALAKKSVKGIFATAYLVGENVASAFRKLKAIGNFVDNTESTYINDLVGHLNGIPVLRHTDIDPNVGYAIHKTSDGQLAPVMRGIYLPLTNTPSIGNYQNPTQVAQGIYYQEANQPIVPELVQKFQLVSAA
jgi:hypothetical protein